jgi:hypothetical protein
MISAASLARQLFRRKLLEFLSRAISIWDAS